MSFGDIGIAGLGQMAVQAGDVGIGVPATVSNPTAIYTSFCLMVFLLSVKKR